MDGEAKAPWGFIQVLELMYAKELLAWSLMPLLHHQLHDRVYFILLKNSPETLCHAQKYQQGLRPSTLEWPQVSGATQQKDLEWMQMKQVGTEGGGCSGV